MVTWYNVTRETSVNISNPHAPNICKREMGDKHLILQILREWIGDGDMYVYTTKTQHHCQAPFYSRNIQPRVKPHQYGPKKREAPPRNRNTRRGMQKSFWYSAT